MTTSDWNFLVVEDERDSMELVHGLLTYHGIPCVEAATGEDALKILRSQIPTLIVIDLALPGMDGWTLLKRIRQNPALAAIPRVAITAYHTAELASKAIEAGFDAYFPKPLDATSFVRELEDLVGGQVRH